MKKLRCDITRAASHAQIRGSGRSGQ